MSQKTPNRSPTTRAQNVTYVTYGSQFLIISPPVPNDLTLVRRPRFGEPCSRTLAMLKKNEGIEVAQSQKNIKLLTEYDMWQELILYVKVLSKKHRDGTTWQQLTTTTTTKAEPGVGDAVAARNTTPLWGCDSHLHRGTPTVSYC